jgi:hypothetical protein
MRIREVIIYGDSTSLPRPTDSVDILDTYYWRLVKFLGNECGLENRSTGGISVKKLKQKVFNDSHYLFPKNFSSEKKLVIINVGVVDASLHPITYKLKVIRYIPIIGKYLWYLVAKILKPFRAKIMSIWRYSMTRPVKFSREFEKIIKFLVDREVLICVLLTPIPHKNLESRSPGFRENVKKYNLLKVKVCEKFSGVHVISLDKFIDTFYVSGLDGHHYSKSGHNYVFDEIKSKLFLND